MTQNPAVMLTREEKEVAYIWGDYIPQGVFRVGDLFLLHGEVLRLAAQDFNQPSNTGMFLLLKPAPPSSASVVLSGLVFSETGTRKNHGITIYPSDFPTNIRFVSRL